MCYKYMCRKATLGGAPCASESDFVMWYVPFVVQKERQNDMQ